MLAGQKIQAFTSGYQDLETAVVSSITVTTPANGATVCGVAFVAPQSGAVHLSIYADLQQTAGVVVVGWRVRTGGTPGSGTIVDGSESGDGPNAANGRVLTTITRIAAGGGNVYVTGLIAGDTYNAATYHFISGGGQGTLSARAITVLPLL